MNMQLQPYVYLMWAIDRAEHGHRHVVWAERGGKRGEAAQAAANPEALGQEKEHV